ncbi:efflux RND transporter permease subunit [Cytobacillus sp. Hm23]
MKISDFSIRRPVFTLVSMLLVIILGFVSLLNIPLKLIPDIKPPIAVVVASYPGANPAEVVEKVTKPLETNLSTLPGLKTLTSTSQESASLTLMEFSWTTSIEDIENEVRSRIDQTQLPDDAGKPSFMKFDPSQFPIIQMSVTANSNDKEELQSLADGLSQELTKIEGIASVNLSGNTIDEIKVELDQDLLQQYSLTQNDIVDFMKAQNISLPGDTILTDGKELTTRVISSITSVDMLKDIAISVDPATGEKVTLGDISEVKVAPQNEDTITRANQEPALLVSVLQQSDANTASVSAAFKEKLDDILGKEKYEDVEAQILFDQGDFIQVAIDNISTTLILGGLFAMVVLFFFLRSVKSPFIIGVAIPYSVILTFVLMYFSDFSLNIMTLGGLALGIGMLVDNSIVVIENIYRHLSMGKDSKEAASHGVKEVAGAITASTFTTIAVFVPVVFITGIIGELFTEFAMTIAFSLFASLVVALTVVPMLASRMLKAPKENKEKVRRESPFMKGLDRAIKWALRRRAVVIITAFVFLGSGLYGITTVGMEFLPKTDEGFFSISVELENGTALTETDKVVEQIENVLADEDDVDVYVSLLGSTQENSFRGTSQGNIAEISVKMKDFDNRERSTFQFVDDVKREIEKEAERVNPTAEVSFNLQSTTGSAPNTLSFSVKDTNKQRLEDAVTKINDELLTIDDVTELTTDLSDTVEEVQMTVDREKAFANGLAPAQIAMAVNNVTRGVNAIRITDENNEIFNVHVSYDKDITSNLDQLKTLLVKKPDGSYIPVEDVADITIGEGPVNIQRINEQNAVQFTLKYSNSTNLSTISSEVDEKIADLDLNDETEITFGGDRDLLESSIDDMVFAFILAIVFVYLVMAAQFESLKYPFVIMFTVPLMVIGVSIGLTVTRVPVSLMAIIGLIVLAGIVVNNAIVLIDYINQKKSDGYKTYDAIVEAVKVRTRPILMTATTTILGLFPLALGLGEGTEMNQPMGITVIGGLISSTFLTLFVIPVVYSFFDKETRRLNKKYATPDGHLIPAYLLDEIHEKPEIKEQAEQLPPVDETIYSEDNLPVVEQKEHKNEDMVSMLENILKIVKDQEEKKNDNIEDDKEK